MMLQSLDDQVMPNVVDSPAFRGQIKKMVDTIVAIQG
jgi:hypothetical protein